MRNRDPQTGLIQLDPVPMEVGDKARVFDGPLAGLERIFRERKGKKHALLSAKLPGTESFVEAAAILLQKAM